jgi:hypothetical protein
MVGLMGCTFRRGIGQCNIAGPGIWEVANTPILKTTKEEGFGLMYKTYLIGQDLHVVGYSFVDDAYLI